MSSKPRKYFKFISLLLCISLFLQQTGFAQVAGEVNISGYLSGLRQSLIQDKFRPLHLRYLSYDPLENNFRLLLDKGSLKNPKNSEIEDASKIVLKYFFIGISLPNDSFWVNLRPDSPDNIIDEDLAKTDIGKIFLESDLQLKKDTAKATSPETPEGREYWNRLYQKAGELFGVSNITIPTLTRPWIVPGEIIIRETADSAYIYKASLKVMLEQDYLKNDAVYNFKDEKLKQLNEYASQLVRELIIPKLTKEINTSKRYASLRQVYYSLIMAHWFKSRFTGKSGLYSSLIDRRKLNGLNSLIPCFKESYFKEYQKSFKDGEYNIKEPIQTPFGQTVRSYFSGGMDLMPKQLAPRPTPANPIVTQGDETVIGATRGVPENRNVREVIVKNGKPTVVEPYSLEAKAELENVSAPAARDGVVGMIKDALGERNRPLDYADIGSGPRAEFESNLLPKLKNSGLAVGNSVSVDKGASVDEIDPGKVKTVDVTVKEERAAAGLADESRDLVTINNIISAGLVQPALAILRNGGVLIITFAAKDLNNEGAYANPGILEEVRAKVKEILDSDPAHEYQIAESEMPQDYPSSNSLNTISYLSHKRILIVTKRAKSAAPAAQITSNTGEVQVENGQGKAQGVSGAPTARQSTVPEELINDKNYSPFNKPKRITFSDGSAIEAYGVLQVNSSNEWTVFSGSVMRQLQLDGSGLPVGRVFFSDGTSTGVVVIKNGLNRWFQERYAGDSSSRADNAPREYLAAKIFKALGITAPDVGLIHLPGGELLYAVEYIPGTYETRSSRGVRGSELIDAAYIWLNKPDPQYLVRQSDRALIAFDNEAILYTLFGKVVQGGYGLGKDYRDYQEAVREIKEFASDKENRDKISAWIAEAGFEFVDTKVIFDEIIRRAESLEHEVRFMCSYNSPYLPIGSTDSPDAVSLLEKENALSADANRARARLANEFNVHGNFVYGVTGSDNLGSQWISSNALLTRNDPLSLYHLWLKEMTAFPLADIEAGRRVSMLRVNLEKVHSPFTNFFRRFRTISERISLPQQISIDAVEVFDLVSGNWISLRERQGLLQPVPTAGDAASLNSLTPLMFLGQISPWIIALGVAAFLVWRFVMPMLKKPGPAAAQEQNSFAAKTAERILESFRQGSFDLEAMAQYVLQSAARESEHSSDIGRVYKAIDESKEYFLEKFGSYQQINKMSAEQFLEKFGQEVVLYNPSKLFEHPEGVSVEAGYIGREFIELKRELARRLGNGDMKKGGQLLWENIRRLGMEKEYFYFHPFFDKDNVFYVNTEFLGDAGFLKAAVFHESLERSIRQYRAQDFHFYFLSSHARLEVVEEELLFLLRLAPGKFSRSAQILLNNRQIELRILKDRAAEEKDPDVALIYRDRIRRFEEMLNRIEKLLTSAALREAAQERGYQIVADAGEGENGIVYKVTDRAGNTRALKIFARQDQSEVNKQFQREIDFLRRLKTAGESKPFSLPTIFESGELIDSPGEHFDYFVTEYFEGKNLDDMRERTETYNELYDLFAWDEGRGYEGALLLVDAMRQIIDGNEYMTSLGILHGNLPRNIKLSAMRDPVTGRRSVRVAFVDFGDARDSGKDGKAPSQGRLYYTVGIGLHALVNNPNTTPGLYDKPVILDTFSGSGIDDQFMEIINGADKLLVRELRLKLDALEQKIKRIMGEQGIPGVPAPVTRQADSAVPSGSSETLNAFSPFLLLCATGPVMLALGVAAFFIWRFLAPKAKASPAVGFASQVGESVATVISDEPLALVQKATHTGRNTDIINILIHCLRSLNGPDLRAGTPVVVDVGVGALPVTTSELAQALKKINPGVTIIGTELPQAVAGAHISSSALLDKFRRKAAVALGFADKDILDLILSVDSNNQPIEIIAKVKFADGSIGYKTLAVAPNAYVKTNTGLITENKASNDTFFMRAIDFLGEDNIRRVLNNEQIDGILLERQPAARMLKDAGARLEVTDDPRAIKEVREQDGATVITVNNVTMHMNPQELNDFKQKMQSALKDGGILVIKNSPIGPETGEASGRSMNTIEIFRKDSGILKSLGVEHSDVDNSELMLFDRQENGFLGALAQRRNDILDELSKEQSLRALPRNTWTQLIKIFNNIELSDQQFKEQCRVIINETAVRLSPEQRNEPKPQPVSSVDLTDKSDKGGIDFRAMPITIKPIPGMAPGLSAPGALAMNTDVDKEWGEIENMLNGGIIPSIERIKEYLETSCASSDCPARMEKALSCIADILRLEEERCSSTDSALKQLLVLLESDKPAVELKLALSGIETMPKDPVLVTP